MKCPRCGSELVLDEHRKYGALMCYECGYMEGRQLGVYSQKEAEAPKGSDVPEEKKA